MNDAISTFGIPLEELGMQQAEAKESTAPVAGKTLDTEQWRRMRKAAMKTQQDVATETGISLSTILAVETGQRNFGIENSVKFIKACKGSAAAKEHLRQFVMKIEKTCKL